MGRLVDAGVRSVPLAAVTLTAPIRNGLAVLIALCLVGGLIGAFTVDGRSASSLKAGAGTTTTVAAVQGGGEPASSDPTTSAAPGSEPATTAAPLTATTAKGKASATTSTTAGASTTTAAPVDLGPPQDPGPATPPKSGTYKYTFSAKDSSGETKKDATNRVEDKGTSGNETRQRVTSAGAGITQASDVSWRPDGVYVLKTTFTFGDKSGDCDWEPDTLQLKLPITKGASWKADSTCTVSGLGPTPFTVSRHVEGTFAELQRVKVGDEVVDVWSIPGKEHVEFAGTTVDSTSVTLFSPKHGLTVKQTSHSKATSANSTDPPKEGDSTLELLSTVPS